MTGKDRERLVLDCIFGQDERTQRCSMGLEF